jgi:hypothetical protein
MKKLFLVLSLLCAVGFANAQNDDEEMDSTLGEDPVFVIPPINEKLKIGVKMGTGASVMLGHELQNPRPHYMISGGVYLHYRFGKHWSVQPETNFAFKGSNFKNGTDQYASIVMYTIDVPVLLMYGFDEKNTKNIFTGIQYSRTLNKSLYNTDAPIAEPTEPRLHNDDWFAVLGTQIQTPWVGFQIAAKYGLRDLNTGLIPNLNPPNTGKDIHMFAFEINLLF